MYFLRQITMKMFDKHYGEGIVFSGYCYSIFMLTLVIEHDYNLVLGNRNMFI